MSAQHGRSTLAVIGGTGHLGSALARRWVKAGHRVLVGSRDAAKARDAAAALSRECNTVVEGGANRDVAGRAGVIVVTVPFASQAATLADIHDAAQGKLVVDCTVPLVPPKVMRVQLPTEGCAAVIAQRTLGDGVTVVSAFHNVAAHKLATDEPVDCDVLVFGESRDARETVVSLARAAGLRGLHAGSLANSAAAEALTSILIFVNKQYGIDGAGVRLTGAFPAG